MSRKQSGKAPPPVTRDAGPERFEEHAERVLGELRDAFTSLANAAPGTVRRAVDLQRALGVDAPLAWRVFKVTRADDPLLAAPYVPTRGQLQTLLDAVAKRGLPAGVLRRTRAAIDDYEEFRREHATDRNTFDAMIGALRPGATGQIDVRTRRAAFKHNAQIWGLEAQTTARALIVYPGNRPDTYGGAVIGGLVGLHAVRPDVPLVVHATARMNPGTRTGDAGAHAHSAEDRSGLLLEFSSPGIELRTEVGENETITTRVCAPGIGRRAAVTTFGLAVFEVPEVQFTEGVTINHVTYTPTELCHIDLLTPVGLTLPRAARMAAYGRRSHVDRVFERRPADLLPIREPAVYIGTSHEVPPASGIPRWPEVVRHVLNEVGARGIAFDIFRCRVPYPVLHTLVSIQVDRAR